VNARHTTVPSDAAHLPALTEFLRDFWSESNLPAGDAVPFELALEEVFMNVVMHGAAADRATRVEVSVALVDGGVILIVEDDGPPLEKRPIGGLGVFLVRKMMDSVRYQRRGARNQLQMTKLVAVGPSTSK
jgi:anti-sigma regulatory factor (Ser/Thr protein kinase)